MSKSMHLKSVAVIFILSAFSLAAAPNSQLIPDSNKAEISIEARCFVVDSNVPSVSDFCTNTLKAKKRADINVVAIPANKELTLFQLNDEQTKTLTKWLESRKDTRMFQLPKVSVRDGGHAHFSITTDHAYAKGYKEPNEAGGKPQPVPETITDGVKFDVTPELQPDKREIVLDMNCQVTNIVKWTNKIYKPGYEISIPSVESTVIQTNMLVPKGQAVLMPTGEKMTFESDNETQYKAYLYLLVDAAVEPNKPDPNFLSSGQK